MSAGCAGLTRYGGLTNQAEKQFQAGQFDDSVRNLVAALEIKPNYLPAGDLLRQAAPRAYEKHEQAIKELEAGKRWDEAVYSYDQLTAVSDAVLRLRAGYPAVEVKDRRAQAAKNAAKHHWRTGQNHFNLKRFESAAEEFLAAHRFISGYKDAGTWAAKSYYENGKALVVRGKFKDAAKSYRHASETVPGFLDAEERYQQARAKAVRRVAVMPFSDQSGRSLGDSISDRIISQVMDGKPEFIELVSRDHLAGLLAEKGLKATSLVDQGSALKAGKLVGVDSFVYGKILVARATVSPEQRIGPRENSIRRRIYGDKERGVPDRDVILTASYTIHSKSSAAKLSASYQIIDALTGRIKSSKTQGDERSDTVKWIMFTGEESAIPASAHEGTTPDRHEPTDPDSLMDQVAGSVSDRMANDLQGYFQ